MPYDSGGEPPPGPGGVPNYATGWGEIDAPAAVDAAARACGPSGVLRGRVTAAGAPLANASVEISAGADGRAYTVATDAGGAYVRRVPANADTGYTVRVSAYGYLPSTESGVRVGADQTVVHDVALAPAPTYKIAGRVTDAATGWPLHARVRIAGYPGAPIWSDAVTGLYSVRLAEGGAYRLDVDSDVPGYRAQSRELADVTGGAVQDFALDADAVACAAPGYAYASTRLVESFEDAAGAPPGWATSSAGLGWQFGTADALSGSVFVIPEHGRFAATTDELGADGGWSNDARYDYLELPALNLAAAAAPVLRYRSFFMADGGSARVEASIDGGASWAPLGTPATTDAVRGWTDEAVSLAAVAAANLRLRFHYDDGTTDDYGVFGYGWAVDDVAVVDACTPPAGGGLVVGHVRDANT
ncbi:MAG TPA: carboxypeptidase-like regulatory domain-containing protein, partial [Dokdonella sp.]